jgi:hypothetical protein
MSFTSWQFGLFAVVVFGLYYLPALKSLQVYVLVVASLVFHGFVANNLSEMTAYMEAAAPSGIGMVGKKSLGTRAPNLLRYRSTGRTTSQYRGS